MGLIRETWSDVTSLNNWVVRDYYRLVKSVNALEPQVQSLSDDQVWWFRSICLFVVLDFFWLFENWVVFVSCSLLLKLRSSGKGWERGRHLLISKLVPNLLCLLEDCPLF